MDSNEFQSPSADWRGKPFWSWNGDLKEEELLRQIHIMKEMGFGGYFMHSRTGLITEYLGEEWFKLINRCAQEGAELGMESWLYDEDRWPSGTAGGLVTENPEYRMKFIYLQVHEGADFSLAECRKQEGIFLGAWSCRVENASRWTARPESPSCAANSTSWESAPGSDVIRETRRTGSSPRFSLPSTRTGSSPTHSSSPTESSLKHC
jgi:hypothetical protein